jgi:hypothetical protein
MLSEFLVYLRLGFEHITDVGGADHLLFVAALTATAARHPKRLIWLVTAFTAGHSLTLVLATLRLVQVSSRPVELLIPATILLTCVVAVRSRETPVRPRTQYGLAAVFGLIHGLGFSAFLRAALGAEESILLPLFAFNTGLEIGQITVVLVLFAAALLLGRLLGVSERAWVLGVSLSAGLGALAMLVQRF